MDIVLGGTGRVGSAVADALLSMGRTVLVTTHDSAKEPELRKRGFHCAVVDVRDHDQLRAVLRSGQRAFLLNPPATPDTDTDRKERETAAAISKAVEGSGLELAVVHSTFGAQKIEKAGDLGILCDFEVGVQSTGVTTTVVRSGYFMSNWDAALKLAAEHGILESLFPPNKKIPMVAPADIGRLAAELLSATVPTAGVHYIEGPARYSTQDVADAFATALSAHVKVAIVAASDWPDWFASKGFSPAAAESYARMTGVVAEDDLRPDVEPDRGSTTLVSYVSELVRRAGNS